MWPFTKKPTKPKEPEPKHGDRRNNGTEVYVFHWYGFELGLIGRWETSPEELRRRELVRIEEDATAAERGRLKALLEAGIGISR